MPLEPPNFLFLPTPTITFEKRKLKKKIIIILYPALSNFDFFFF